jgi:serine/threonine protein kinase
MIPDRLDIRRLDPQGRFEDWQPLGEGTTAQVFAAVDRFSGRQVVLKMARDRDMARLFRGEVELLRRLSAPVFPELLDFVPDGDGVTLIVMERRGGRPLDPADTRDLSAAGLARLLAPLAQGLCELADLHHLHGDISPGNVLLDHTRVSLLDLGLARPLDQGLVDRSGTLATMAPERLASGRLHGGGDIWSLGVLGWTLICGHPPFPDETDACVRAILDGQRRPPGQGADHPLMPLMLRCLEPDPEKRPTAQTLLHELLVYSQAGPELVPRRPAASQVPDWCRQLLAELGAGHSGTVWGSGAGEEWVWLDWLQHESALAGLRLLHLDTGRDSPLEWARLHLLRHPGLVEQP